MTYFSPIPSGSLRHMSVLRRWVAVFYSFLLWLPLLGMGRVLSLSCNVVLSVLFSFHNSSPGKRELVVLLLLLLTFGC